MRLILICFYLLLATTGPAQAYIGPGLGAGTVAVILGVIASVFLALFAILWYPIKRLIKKLKAREKGLSTDQQAPESEGQK